MIVCAIDCETTGLHSKHRRAWQIGAIRRDEETGITEELLVNVEVSLADADPQALAIGDFYANHPLGQHISGFGEDVCMPEPLDDIECIYAVGVAPEDDSPDYVTARLAAYLVAHWTHGAYLIGSRPGFDTETFEPLLYAHGLAPSWQHHPGDVACMLGGRPPWSLRNVEAKLGLPPHEASAHNALECAGRTLTVYERVIEREDRLAAKAERELDLARQLGMVGA